MWRLWSIGEGSLLRWNGEENDRVGSKNISGCLYHQVEKLSVVPC